MTKTKVIWIRSSTPKSKHVFPGFSLFDNSTSLSLGDWNEAENRSHVNMPHIISRVLKMHPCDQSRQPKTCFIAWLTLSHAYPLGGVYVSFLHFLCLNSPSSPFWLNLELYLIHKPQQKWSPSPSCPPPQSDKRSLLGNRTPSFSYCSGCHCILLSLIVSLNEISSSTY